MTRLKTVRADIGKHRLSAGVLAGTAVGKLADDQLADATAQLEHEIERMAKLDDDAAVKKLRRDLKAIAGERERRGVDLVAC